MEYSSSDTELDVCSGVLMPFTGIPAFASPAFVFSASTEAPAPVRVTISEPSFSDEPDFCSSVAEPSSELSSGSESAGGGRVAEKVGIFGEAGSLES